MTTREGATVRTDWYMPAEWAPHERTLLAWPTRKEIWGSHYTAVCNQYAGTANTIAEFEPVTVIVNPGSRTEAARLLTGDIELLEIPINDSWVRDSGPIGVLDHRGNRAGVDFRFNAWGERFRPYDSDNASAARILEAFDIPRIGSDLVLEGGSISVDGNDTLITTEECLLHPNRNPDRNRSEIEAELRMQLGVDTIIWLPWGHADDLHTNGHVDTVCAFIGPGKVIALTCADPANPNHERLARNREVLANARDATGQALEIIELPWLPYYDLSARELALSYVNFYFVNGGVVMPVADHPFDADARALLQEVFPERKVVPVPAQIIFHGGGGVHCITQQVPQVVETG